jgi:hypothetical protein
MRVFFYRNCRFCAGNFWMLACFCAPESGPQLTWLVVCWLTTGSICVSAIPLYPSTVIPLLSFWPNNASVASVVTMGFRYSRNSFERCTAIRCSSLVTNRFRRTVTTLLSFRRFVIHCFKRTFHSKRKKIRLRSPCYLYVAFPFQFWIHSPISKKFGMSFVPHEAPPTFYFFIFYNW